LEIGDAQKTVQAQTEDVQKQEKSQKVTIFFFKKKEMLRKHDKAQIGDAQAQTEDVQKTGEAQKELQKQTGDAGYRSPYLSHAKRAFYHLNYIPLYA
jgi:hypothetical protein